MPSRCEHFVISDNFHRALTLVVAAINTAQTNKDNIPIRLDFPCGCNWKNDSRKYYEELYHFIAIDDASLFH